MGDKSIRQFARRRRCESVAWASSQSRASDFHEKWNEWSNRPPFPLHDLSLLRVSLGRPTYVPLRTRNQRGEESNPRESLLTGWWGWHVNWTDGRHFYMRAPATKDNQPLYFYTNRWAPPPWWNLPGPDDRTEFGRFMPRVDMPMCRQPIRTEEMPRANNISLENLRKGSLLFDLLEDPDQQENLVGGSAEKDAESQLRALMKRQTSPPEQFIRLGLE